QAEEQAKDVVRQAEEHTEQLKVDADSYVAETLRNLKDHLASLEMDISRSILSIEKGLESLDMPEDGEYEEGEIYEEENEDDDEQALSSRPIPRRASLANDTIGGPMY
ncbi:MAG: hypothetical protein ACJ8AG_19540, partial [Ktedonobacteraceae bacterium]